MKIKRIAALAAIAALLSAGIAVAAEPTVTRVVDLKEGTTVTTDVLDFGVGPKVALPPGQTWKVVVNADFKLEINSGRPESVTRITLLNENKDTPIQMLSISANSKSYNYFSPSSEYCTYLPGVLKQSYPELGSNMYGCSVAIGFRDLASKLSTLEKTTVDKWSRGLLTGLILPLKQQPELMARIGKNPIFVTDHMVRYGRQTVYYTLVLKNDSEYVPATVPVIDAELDAWIRLFFKAAHTYLNELPDPSKFPPLGPIMSSYSGPAIELGKPLESFDRSILHPNSRELLEKKFESDNIANGYLWLLDGGIHVCFTSNQAWFLDALIGAGSCANRGTVPIFANGRYFPNEKFGYAR